MTNITIPKFVRVLNRAAELFDDRDTNPRVKRLYADVVLPLAIAFRSMFSAEQAAESTVNAARIDAATSMAELDTEYRVVRSILAGRFAGLVLPGTLKEQPTDTDAKSAVQTLFDTVEAHRTEPWADEILAGPFGTQAPDCIAKITASVAARSALSTAVTNRTTAMDKAYAAVLLFKDAVRQAHGTRSSQYSRLRLRGKAAITAPTPPPDTPTVSPSAPVVEAPTNGAAAH